MKWPAGTTDDLRLYFFEGFMPTRLTRATTCTSSLPEPAALRGMWFSNNGGVLATLTTFSVTRN